ncbi:MAG TPA: glycoside hydrolase family 76 protein, partial [Verrucomicrobiae bacterium]|nr:glycoside hydrolase family 76 protein [Verrucomicrobiae bacterium]
MSTIIFGARISADAFTTNEVNSMVDAYCKAFYAGDGGIGYFKNEKTGGEADFWKSSEEIESVLDAYEWTSNAAYKPMISSLLNGFEKRNGAIWSSNIYNDDCMWAAIAFARGYLDTGNTRFGSVAMANFDMVFARAWDNAIGGGLWWTTKNTTKNACVNGPGAIAAYLLYKCSGDTEYLVKAFQIYDWERKNLFVAETGKIFDAERTNGIPRGRPTTYNQGTFIGAANFLGRTNDAMLAADYTMNSMCTDGLLPQYGQNGNNSGFNAIFLRWLVKFMKDRGMQSRYQSWLQQNADAAWKVRRASDNLSWCQWREPTPPEANLNSW